MALAALALGALGGLLLRSRMQLTIRTSEFLKQIEKLLLANNLERAVKLSRAHDGPVACLTHDALTSPNGQAHPSGRLEADLVRDRIERHLNERLAPALWGQWPARALGAAALASSALVAARVAPAGYPMLALADALLAGALLLNWTDELRWVRELNTVLRRLPEIAGRL
jgi:hypothetical protein